VNKSQFAECAEEGNWQQTVGFKWITFSNFSHFYLVTDNYRTWNIFVEPAMKFLCMK